MALIWAPRNHIECLFGYWIYVIRTGMCEISVATLSGIFLSLNVLCFLLHQQLASSEAAHLLGAVFGIELSVFLLKTGRVDCEGWDLFSVWRGEPGTRTLGEKNDSRDHRTASEEDVRHRSVGARGRMTVSCVLQFIRNPSSFRIAQSNISFCDMADIRMR